MKIHPVCELFPSMSLAEYEEFKADLKERGQIDPILTHKGYVVDGKHRLKALTELRIDPMFKEWDGDGSLTSFVISKNLRRRHLEPSQRAIIGAEAIPLFETEAKQRQERGVVSAHGAKGKSADFAAKSVGSATRTVERAVAVKKASPEKAEAVRSGEKTLRKAEREIREEKQAEKPPEDGLGHPVENEGLWAAFRSAEFSEIQSDIQRIRKRLASLAETPLGAHIHIQSLDAHLKNAWQDVKFAAPFAPCVYCKHGCKACRKQGWIPKLVYDSAPSEMKA